MQPQERSNPQNESTFAVNAASMIPADDLRRKITVTQPDEDRLPHLSVMGDTYTILVGGKDTAGRHCLIDMFVPQGGGPPPHRHDFEEMFTILEGEIEFVFRGEKSVARAGQTLNIPANAPHSFKNISGRSARLLCMATPPGLDEMFMELGDRVRSRTAAPPDLSEAEKAGRMQRARTLAPKFRTELLVS